MRNSIRRKISEIVSWCYSYLNVHIYRLSLKNCILPLYRSARRFKPSACAYRATPATQFFVIYPTSATSFSTRLYTAKTVSSTHCNTRRERSDHEQRILTVDSYFWVFGRPPLWRKISSVEFGRWFSYSPFGSAPHRLHHPQQVIYLFCSFEAFIQRGIWFDFIVGDLSRGVLTNPQWGPNIASHNTPWSPWDPIKQVVVGGYANPNILPG